MWPGLREKTSRGAQFGFALSDAMGGGGPRMTVAALAPLIGWDALPSDEALIAWTDWCLEQVRSGKSCWCYFNNDIHGHAIEDARTLKSMVGQMAR